MSHRSRVVPRRPLPEKLDRLVPGRPGRRGDDNVGLFLDKFVPRDGGDWTFQSEFRRDVLSDYAGEWSRPMAGQALARRINGMEHHAPDGASVGEWYRGDGLLLCRQTAQLEARLLVDYGRTTVIESSVSFHPILGVPRIPGTALKGITGAWNIEADGARDPALGQGPEASQGARRGTVDFLDALPANGHFALALDVLTPHYGPYYRGVSPPGDWLSPVPFTFLTVVNTRFVFDLVARAKDEADLIRLSATLAEALVEHGVGAKTAAGYGYFGEDIETLEP